MTSTSIDRVRCGAKTRAGGRCRRDAGARTMHPGKGRCWMHGGLQVDGDARLKSGRYSGVLEQELGTSIAEFEKDPDPLNLLPEIAALRALFQNFINRYTVTTEALLAWHASWQITRRPLPEEQLMAFEAVIAEWENSLVEQGDNATEKQTADVALARTFVKILRGEDAAVRPRQVMDLSDAAGILGEIGKMVERVEKARTANAISRPELYRVIGEMGRVVDQHTPDPVARAAIVKGWNAIAF